MGVKLNELFKDQIDKPYKTITIKNLFNKRIAIDAFNHIYQFISVIRGADHSLLKNRDGEVTSHLVGLWNRNKRFLMNNIQPVWVFDGKPSKLKMEEIHRRREIKQKAERDMMEADSQGNEMAMEKFAKRTSRITSDMIAKSKQLLTLMGIPYIEAPQEAEAQSGYLVRSKQVWGSATQDFDAFLFNTPRIVRNLSYGKTRRVYGKTVNVSIEFWNIRETLKELNLTQEQLVDIGVLIGTDFYEGLKGIGTKTAYTLITKYKTIDTMVKENVEYRGVALHEIDMDKVNQIRDIFLNPVIDTKNYNLRWKKPNEKGLTQFLIAENDFGRDRTEKQIASLVSAMSKKKQTTLSKYF